MEKYIPYIITGSITLIVGLILNWIIHAYMKPFIDSNKEKEKRKALIDSALIELIESKTSLENTLKSKLPNQSGMRIIFAIDELEKIYNASHEFKFDVNNKINFSAKMDYLRKTKGETSRTEGEIFTILTNINEMKKFITKSIINNYYFDFK